MIGVCSCQMSFCLQFAVNALNVVTDVSVVSAIRAIHGHHHCFVPYVKCQSEVNCLRFLKSVRDTIRIVLQQISSTSRQDFIGGFYQQYVCGLLEPIFFQLEVLAFVTFN